MVRAALLAVLLLAGCGSHASPSAFRPGPCGFAPPPGIRVDCGRLTVPEDRARPGGRTVDLAVAIFRSGSEHPRPDPVLFLTGGPGAAGIALARHLYPTLVAPFLRERDLVVFDPRGTGRSRPSLACRPDESRVACLLRWRDGGVDLSAYQSAATADDVEDLRRALAIDRFNLFGLSYGTRLGLTVLRDHPDHVRSAVLDSVVPLGIDDLAATTRNAAEGIERLLDACAADPACRRSHPDLPSALREAARRLDEQPLPLGNGDSLDGAGLVQLVFDAIYDAPNLPLLPRAIDAARDGVLDPLWPAVTERNRLIASIVAQAAHDAWMCNEERPFTTPPRLAAVDARYPEAAAVFSPRRVFELCRALRPAHPAALENRAVESDVPVLLLAGRFDPVTPVENARLAARTLPHGRVVVFPTLGHGVYAASCARRIALAFLAEPLRAPDTGCVARMPAIAWAGTG